MRLALAPTLIFILFLYSGSLIAQDAPLVSTRSTPTLDKKSYALLKYKMDSVLYIMLDEYKGLEKTLRNIEKEQTDDLSDEDKKILDQEFRVTKERLKLLTELRKQGINLQLDLSYNRKSYAMGMACAKYLREEFQVMVFPGILNLALGEKTHSKKENRNEEVASSPLTYVDILEESKPVYSFLVEPDWKELPMDCHFTTNGYDFNTKRKTISVSHQHFFSYTHPKLKQFYKNKDALVATVALTQIDNEYYLNLKINIGSKDANKSYGLIQKSAVLVMELIDNKKEYGRAINQIIGKYDALSKITSYDIFYEIDKETLNSIAKKELNTIGIFWSSGFEQYNIYEVEALMNQANCLKKQS